MTISIRAREKHSPWADGGISHLAVPVAPPKTDESQPYHHLLNDLVANVSSPFHGMLPDALVSNVIRFKRALVKHLGPRHEILYAMKTNNSASLLSAAVESGSGIDVASEYEFSKALQAGVKAELCSLSGPFKSDKFLSMAIRQGSRISVDSAEELQAVSSLAIALKRTARVLLRWNGEQKLTRFGMPMETLVIQASIAKSLSGITLEGAHFHLSGYCPNKRANALSQLLDTVDRLKQQGINLHTINIGGGFPMQYLQKDVWENYQQEVNDQHFHGAQQPSDYYPHWGPFTIEETIETILTTHGNATRLIENDIKLLIEPGRSLVDNAGFTVYRVLGTKTTLSGSHCVIVEGLSMSMSEHWFNSEFVVDPILLTASTRDTETYPAYIAGQSCLEDDVLGHRLVAFPTQPKRGDLLVYNNTAGYMQDLLETQFHGIPLPKKIAFNTNNNTTQWKLER